jgi:hypothetical protein
MAIKGIRKQIANDIDDVNGDFLVLDKLSIDKTSDTITMLYNIYQTEAAYNAKMPPVYHVMKQIKISSLGAQALSVIDFVFDGAINKTIEQYKVLKNGEVVNR